MTIVATVVALDVDGTLFDGRSVDPRAVEAVRRARDAGHTVMIVTGRPWRDLPVIIPDVLAAATVAVCEHGALMVDVATERVTNLAPAVERWVRDAIADADAEELEVFEATLGLPASALALAEEVCDRPGSGCYVVTNKASIAIVPIGCDKGTGLERAISHLGLHGHRIIAIGDAVNDVPMFERADVPIAVANAEQALIDTGVEVTDGEFGAGVAEALERYLDPANA